MTKSVKSSKKKATFGKIKDTESSDDQSLPNFTTTASKEDSQEWTPAQLEQIELADKLHEYINSFQKKLLGLNFTPSDRELVILFIMYLHPRWRRFVEPMELSCSTWIEAAAYAKLHCGRVSAMLGCEKIGSDCIFNTPESRALRDSNYFAPEQDIKEKETPAGFSKKPAKTEFRDPLVDAYASTAIINAIPKAHKGINLTFLNLPVNGKTVKALIAKSSWQRSAISIDCAERLGLEMDDRTDLIAETDFGCAYTLGEALLTFHHPADPENLMGNIQLLVLPKIYGGSVELVLGADFFFLHQPVVLNIKKRAIYFLGKETPYIVEQL